MYIPNTERLEKTLQFNIILHGINNGVAQQDFFLSSSTVIHTRVLLIFQTLLY